MRWPFSRKQPQRDPNEVLASEMELYAQWCDAAANLYTNMDWPTYRIAMTFFRSMPYNLTS